MAYTVVKIGKMASTNVDAYLRSVQATFDMENGSHVVLGDAVSGNPDVFVASTPTDVTTQEVYIVESPVLIEVSGYRINGVVDPTLFINPANRPCRARKLKVGDVVNMTLDGFSSAPTVGQYAVPANGALTLAPAANLTGSTIIAYKVKSTETFSIGQTRSTGYKLEVVVAP